ncbi:MAG: D-glycero-beta-D-manno-heptose 1,7-bisphosphate 7-phosphatase [Gammaproteobacteria bacterium]|nr:D-glycero-beta-D-manno-heptose 1,7-bisphosphate 7-phosphatase [Gammaproteobacteria bacterium]
MSTDDGGARPPLVILDRDGVINEDSDDYIKSVDEWIPIPGSLEAIARLNHAGILVAVASNQSGIGRGLFGVETLNAMHAKLQLALARVGGHVDAILFCPHTPDAGCACRKPAPGLLLQIGERFAVPLAGVPFIGDSAADVGAARAVDARPLLVRSGKGERTLAAQPAFAALPVFADLAAAVDALLAGDAGA